MKGKMLVVVGIMVLALGLVGSADSWATSVQDVDFFLSASGGTLTFQINNVDNASGNWDGIGDLIAVEFKDIGLNSNNGDTLTSNDGFTYVPQSEINAGGVPCDSTQGQSGNSFCFDAHNTLLANNNTFTFAYTGTVDLSGNSVKAEFSIGGAPCTPGCQILSQPIGGPPVTSPEPASLLLLGAGLAGIGIWRRKLA